MKIYLLILFILLCIAQWLVPATMIADQESILGTGKSFKFKTQPVDPTDPFRGSYITLYFDQDKFNVTDTSWMIGEPIFVLLKQDSNGFATISNVVRERPEGTDYVKAKVQYISWKYGYSRAENKAINIEYPFERFYVEESKAKGTERVYRENNRSDSTTTYALVHIKNGNAALKDVMINDESIIDIVKRTNN